MNTAVIYARYSSDSQTEQSIEGQLNVCKEYAQNNNYLIVDTYIDRAMTGTNDLRPAFQKMMRDSAKKQWDTILVYKLDRFPRNKYESTIHKKALKDNGIKVVSAMENIPDSPEGIILEALLEGMNQYFSAELSQKVQRGLKESYRKGNYTGGFVLYGYDVVDKKNVINPSESEIVKEIFTKYSQGYTAASIAKDLRNRGIRTKRGKYIDEVKIYKIISNTKYNGRVKHGDIVYTNIFPKIIDDEIWNKVQDIRNSNKHSPGRKKEVFDFILSGKLACGDCKRMMVGESGTSHTGERHYYYSCLARRREKQPCSMKSVNKQWLEDAVINTTWAFLSDGDCIHTIAEKLCSMHEAQQRDNAVLKDLENKRLTALKASENLIKAIEEGIITKQTKTRLKELEAQICELEFDIEQARNKNYTYLSVNDIENYLRSFAIGDLSDIDARKALIHTFVREIVLYSDKIMITYNFSDRYDVCEITKDRIEEIEKQSVKTAFSFTVSSYKQNASAPSGTVFELTVPLFYFQRHFWLYMSNKKIHTDIVG